MHTFLVALLPVMMIIITGFVLKQLNLPGSDAWRGVERITYFVLFPSLLVSTLAQRKLHGLPWQEMLQIIALVLILASVVLIAWYKLFSNSSGSTFTSIFQGGVRFNTYITLSVAYSLYGEQGLMLASVVAGFMIVIVNVLCVLAFAIWGGSARSGVRAFFKEVVTNPLIVACVVGLFLSSSGIGLNRYLGDALQMLGRAALPLGLLTVGAALNLRALRYHAMPIVISSLVQFGLKPLAIYLAFMQFGLNGVAAAVIFIAFTTPTSPSSFILARQLGGDAETMVSIITFQTLLGFVAMPLLALVLLV